jgi:hypothetical protein
MPLAKWSPALFAIAGTRPVQLVAAWLRTGLHVRDQILHGAISNTQYLAASSAHAENQSHPATADLISILERLSGFRCDLLFVDESKVGAVQILDKIGTPLDKDTSVSPGDSPILATVRHEIHLRIDAADGILTANEDLLSGRQRDLSA